MDIFEYKKMTARDINFEASEVIQADVEDNLPLFLDKQPEEIKNVVIVGAWQGDEVRSFLNFPNINIFCFEPNPETFAILRNLYGQYKNIFCFQKACSANNGKATFYETNMDGNGSMLEIDKHFSAKQTNALEVSTVRLDSLKELENKVIDLLWVDVQGFELEVLKGAENILQNVQALFLEVSTTGGSYKNAVKVGALDSFALEYGFQRAAQGFGEQGVEGNALYLKTGNQTKALTSENEVTLRAQRALEHRSKKRKVYQSPLFRLVHRLTPQKVRTFFKKRLKKLR